MIKPSAKTRNKSLSIPAGEIRISNAYLCAEASYPEVEAQAANLHRLITDLPDRLPKTGKCWYVSDSGSAENSGESPEEAWDSLDTLNGNNDRIQSGDTVLFRRGDLFRGCVYSKSGVSYGAYGQGEKPRLYGSMRDHIRDNWHEISDGIWTVECEFPADVGNIIFDNGQMVGVKKIQREEITDYFDYWCDHEDGNRIYIKLFCHPGELFHSIEIAFNLWMFRIDIHSYDILVENLDFRYCGGHGIRACHAKNITVRGCEFRFIGGSFLSGFRDGTVRYGNAMEFMTGCENILVEHCYADQIYDSAITHQGLGSYCADGIVFRNNLLEYCGMGSIEYWLGKHSKCKNVLYKNNIMRFAGYGFGGIQRPDKNMTAHIQSNGACLNEAENFRIEGNIFERSTHDLINAQSGMNTPPVLSGNVYIQGKGERLGSYAEHKDCLTGDDAEDTVKHLWNDAKAKVYY